MNGNWVHASLRKERDDYCDLKGSIDGQRVGCKRRSIESHTFVIVFYTLALRKLLKKYPKGVDTKICCLKKMQKNGRTRGHVRPSELEMYIKSEKGL